MDQHVSRTTPPSLQALFAVFFRLGMLSFGGGLSGWIHQEVVTRRHWMTDEQLLAGVAVGQVLPGGNAVNLALFVGQHLRGAAGFATCGVAMLFPPFVFILLLAWAYRAVAGLHGTQFVLSGLAAAGVGMTLVMGVRGATRVRGLVPVAIAAALFLGVGVLQWPMIPMVALFAPISVGLAWRDRARA